MLIKWNSPISFLNRVTTLEVKSSASFVTPINELELPATQTIVLMVGCTSSSGSMTA